MGKKLFSGGIKIQAFKVPLVFAIITLIGFWPLVTGQFSVKNDDIIYFLPYRYNIVESIQNGFFPLWSPYIYMGMPVSGDMQSGVWNPVLWLLSVTGRYTLTTLHAELLIYIFLGGLGIFKLARALRFSEIVAYTIAVSYMCSGFITDSGQILAWVSCAGFLPYTFRYAIELCTTPSPSASVKFAAANYLLMVAGGYPFFFIAGMYFLGAAFVVFLIYGHRDHQLAGRRAVLKFVTLSIVILLLVSAAPVLSFVDLMPFYARGEGLPLKDALFNSLSPFSFLSFFFPFAVTREHAGFGNNIDISRNLYFGILLIPFVVVGILKQRTAWWNTILVIAMLAAALSLAELLPFRRWAYLYLPLMDSFRHPANFRLFVTLALLLFAGKGLDQVLSSAGRTEKRIAQLVFVILAAGVVFLAVLFFPSGGQISLNGFAATATGFKNVLAHIDFRVAVLLGLLLQLPFLIAGIILAKNGKYRWLCLASMLNVIVAAQPQLFTGTVGNYPTGQINRYINSQPEGFPSPDNTAATGMPDENTSLFYGYKAPLASFFNKKITVNTSINNPTILKNYRVLLSDSQLVNNIRSYPFAYIADSFTTGGKTAQVQEKWLKAKTPVLSSNVTVEEFTPNGFSFDIKTNTPAKFVVLQNNLPGWKAEIGGKSLPIQTVNSTFMGMNIPAGTSVVYMKYQPKWLMPGMVASLLGIILSGFVLLGAWKRQTANGKRQAGDNEE